MKPEPGILDGMECHARTADTRLVKLAAHCQT